VFTIAHRRVVDAQRRRHRRPSTPMPDDELVPLAEALDAGPDELATLVDRLDAAGHIDALLAHLTDEQREVLVLRFIADLDATTVGEVTGRSTNAGRRDHAACAAPSAGGGDDLPVVMLASGAPGAAADAAASPLRSSAEAGTDLMWWTPTIHRFVLADGVAFPAGAAPAWRLVPPGDLSAAAGRLAATLGLPAPTPSEWDPNALQSSPEDGAGLWVGPSGDWYFHGPYDSSMMWDCPETSGDAGPDADVSARPYAEDACTAPQPPSGVPSEARARELALAFLARVGHSQVRITDVYADEWGAWVSAEPIVEGLPGGSGLAVSVGFGGEERVTSANGTLASVERVGEYPTIDAAAALARLEAELSAWMTDGGPVARPLPADDAPVRRPRRRWPCGRAGPWSVFDLRPVTASGPTTRSAATSTRCRSSRARTPRRRSSRIVRHPDDAYPGAGAVATFADRACLTALEADLDLTDRRRCRVLLPPADLRGLEQER
jgi:hypothetical protein